MSQAIIVNPIQDWSPALLHQDTVSTVLTAWSSLVISLANLDLHKHSVASSCRKCDMRQQRTPSGLAQEWSLGAWMHLIVCSVGDPRAEQHRRELDIYVHVIMNNWTVLNMPTQGEWISEAVWNIKLGKLTVSIYCHCKNQSKTSIFISFYLFISLFWLSLVYSFIMSWTVPIN